MLLWLRFFGVKKITRLSQLSSKISILMGFAKSRLKMPIMDFASTTYLPEVRSISKLYLFTVLTNTFTSLMELSWMLKDFIINSPFCKKNIWYSNLHSLYIICSKKSRDNLQNQEKKKNLWISDKKVMNRPTKMWRNLFFLWIFSGFPLQVFDVVV